MKESGNETDPTRSFLGLYVLNPDAGLFPFHAYKGVAWRPALYAHTARALATGRYPLPSLTL